jgi:hypothetical protein
MSKKILKLNRLLVTGHLSEYTPYCVVKEILEAHNISHTILPKEELNFSHQQLEIQRILKFRTLEIESNESNNFDEKSLRYLATFVNPKVKTWTKSSLLKCYDHMMNFEYESIEKLRKLDINFNSKSPENIKGLNACMLYKICLYYHIYTKWNTNESDMVFMIKKLFEPANEIRLHLTNLIQSLDKTRLINLYLNIPKHNQKINFTIKNIDEVLNDNPLLNLEHEKITDSIIKFRDINYVLQNVFPTNHNDAIVLTALNYKLNVTESKYPLDEYKAILKNPSLELYVPYDPIFRKNYLKSPKWYDTRNVWNINLSELYNEGDLKNMCITEGFTVDDFRNSEPQILLLQSQTCNTFYYGKNPYNLEQTESPIMCEVLEDLKEEDCLSYGNYSKKSFVTYSIDEIYTLFMTYRSYVNPTDVHQCLGKRVINKLKFIAQKYNIIKLLSIISELDKWYEYSNENTERLRELYSKASVERRTYIKRYFEALTKCGMYMRGWDGESEYPLGEKSTLKVNIRYENIEQNVSNSISNVMEFIKDNLYEDEKEVLVKLPLMKYTKYHDENFNFKAVTFVPSPDPEDGNTIVERLEIVSKGSSYKNMKSCIRLSSNIILTSVYFYSISLNLDEPYNINNLEHIT